MPGKRAIFGTLFSAKLAASGFTKTDARRLGYRLLSGNQVAAIASNFRPRAGILIPYFTLRGRPLKDYCRVRYLEPPSGFDRLTPAPKYVQPTDTPPRAYFPPLVRWSEVVTSNEPLIITEGEFKAACAAKYGWFTIGLGGVYAWKSKKLGASFLPELEEFEWKDRSVYLVFDSDVHYKPPVRQALTDLADALLSRGARPYQVVLPPIAVDKTGLDDFLVARGPGALETLFEIATEYRPSQLLWNLSNKVAWVRDPGVVVKLATGQRMTYQSFLQGHYVNQWIDVVKIHPTTGEARLTRKPLAKEWFTWEHRAELEKIAYLPGEPRITTTGAYNLWRGWGVTPKRGSVALWKELLRYLFGKNEKKLAWFERWCAIQLQRPGTKLYSAVLLWGRHQGTGKSLVGYTLGRLFGENFREIHTEDLYARYNDWAANSQFVLGDEIGSSSALHHDRRLAGDVIKRLITRETVRINQKYLPTFELADCINYLFTSNHPDAFYIEPGDRRFFVHEVTEPPLDEDFYERFDKWYRGPSIAALFDYLLRVDLGEFNARAPAFATYDKTEMILLSASDLDAWLYELHEHPYEVLEAVGIDNPSDLWTADQLRRLYDPEGRQRLTTNGMARALKRAGFVNAGGARGTTVTKHGVRRLWAVANLPKWTRAKPREASEHYAKHFPDAAEATAKNRY